MVDIGSGTLAAARETGVRHVDCVVHAGTEAALGALDAVPGDAICSEYQRRDFLRAWLAHSPHVPVFVTLRAGNAGPVLLPLERTRDDLLAYPGERHANGNFPVGRAPDIDALRKAGEAAISDALRRAGTGASAIMLERQWRRLDGAANPFIFGNSQKSPNPALALSLEGGFDAVLARHSAKRRRKRFRSQERRLSDLGGYRFVPAVGAHGIADILDQFYSMKAKRFDDAGIRDVFADDHVRAFFRDLFVQALDESSPPRELKTLEVDGRTIAIIGCSIVDKRVTVEFGSFDDAYGEIGPGDMLFFLAIREAAEKGLDFFDFGIGDEFYKRGWCELETWQYDTAIALNAAGRLRAAATRARNSAVRAVKGNDVLWKSVKLLRRRISLLR